MREGGKMHRHSVMESPRSHGENLVFYFRVNVSYSFQKDYRGSLSLEEYKFLCVSNFTVGKKPDFRIRTIWV